MKELNEDKFTAWIPFEIEKGNDAMDKYANMRIKGIASTIHSGRDSDGELLEVDGMDVRDLVTTGTINYHHLWTKDPSAIIGEPTKAEIRNGELYVEGKLYPSSQKARDVYDLAEVFENDSDNRRLGISIEGKALLRNPKDKKHILKSKIVGFAITPMPKNKGTRCEIMKGSMLDIFKAELDGIEEGNEYLVDTTDSNGIRRTVDRDFNIKVWDDDLEKGGPGSGRHKEGDIVEYEGKKYKAGKHDPSVNLRYLHDIKTGKHAEDHKGDKLQVHESRVQSIEKAMVAGDITGRETTNQTLTQQPLKKESVAGTKKKKKKDEDDDGKVIKPLTKGEAIVSLMDEGFDAESSRLIYELACEIGELVKGGEGSRGGKVIGHTKSGKPIYDTHSHESHAEFSASDHKEARAIHEKKAMKHYDIMHTAGIPVNKRKSSGQKYSEHMRQANSHMESAHSKSKEDPTWGKHSQLKQKWDDMDRGKKVKFLNDNGGYGDKYADYHYTKLTPAIQEELLKLLKN